MRIALYTSAQDNTPVEVDPTWDQLAGDLSKHEITPCAPCPGKDCNRKNSAAWSPVDLTEPKRANANVRAITVAVFDLDHVAIPQLAALAKSLDGFAYVCHSTHTPGCYRLVLPLSRAVLASEWPRFLANAIRKFSIPADPACKDLARLYYFPSCPSDREPEVYSAEGAPLDVESILEADLGEPSRADLSAAVLPADYVAGPLDLDPIQTALRRQRKHADLARKILDGLPLAQPGARDSTVNQAASLVATCPKQIPSWAQACAVLTPSIRAMDCAPEGEAHWLAKAQDSFARAAARRTQKDAQAEADQQAMLALVRPVNADDNWRSGLMYSVDADGEPTGLKNCEANVRLVLKHDPEWAGTLRFNLVSKEIDVFGGPLAGVDPNSRDMEALCWLQRSQYKLSLKHHVVGSILASVARDCAYDPLADYLNSLEWDGTERITGLFADYFGAEPSPLVAAISRRWIISAVARGLNPGCKVDTILVLEGGQGKFKSTACDVLGSPWFTDTKINLHDKDSRVIASSRWLIEIGELAGFSRADEELRKTFLSARMDYLRPPYGRVSELFKRRCVFVGTTNADDYLSDPSGLRRYWPIRCGTIDIEGLRNDRDQLYAEAVVAYKAGERWWLAEDELKLGEESAQERARPGSKTESVLSWWLRMSPEKRPSAVTGGEVARDALALMPGQISHTVLTEVGIAMKELGFTKIRQRRAGVLIWVYRPPENLRTALAGSPAHAPLSSSPEAQA